MDNVRIVERYFDAWRRGDVERLEALLDPRMSASGPLATVHSAHDHAASLARSSAMFRDIAVDQMLADGNVVISWFRFELAGGPTVRAANRCEIAGGLISAVEVTFDPRPLIAYRPR